MFIDPSGLAPTFFQGSDGKWHFLMDNKGLNAVISLFGVIPFLDIGSYYSSSSFDTMLTNFVAYTEIVKDLTDKGIVTYKTSWGIDMVYTNIGPGVWEWR